MAKCRECEKEFTPKEPEATRLFHANRAGFCSADCDNKAGRRYDMDVTHGGAFGVHRNHDRISSHD